jgi:hypothetical protein
MALKWLTALCDEDSLFNLKLDIVVVDGDIVERRTAGLDLNGSLNSVYRKVNVYEQRAISHRRATLEHERNYWGAWSGRINLDGSRIHYTPSFNVAPTPVTGFSMSSVAPLATDIATLSTSTPL